MPAKSRISGITVEIGGDTTGLDKALSSTNKEINVTKNELKDVEKLLKLDPANTELISQKQRLLGEEIEQTKGKLNALKEAEKQVQKQFEEGKISRNQYDALKREIIETDRKLDALKQTEKDFGDEVKSMNAESEMNALEKSVNEVEEALEGAQEQAGLLADGLGTDSIEDAASNFSIFSESLKASLMSSAIQAGLKFVKDGIEDIVESSIGLGLEGQKAISGFAAKTGTAKEELGDFRDVMYDVYSDNFGSSMEEITDYMAEITQQMGEMDPSSLKEMTEYAFALSDTFGYDVKEQTRSAKMMMKQFGLTGKQAYNLIAQGAQKGLDKNGDMLDTINEYSVHFEQLGFDAEEMFNILLNGTEEGTFSVDKLGDAMKEFGIRAKDGSDTSREAFEALGLDADEMFAAFSNGGETAKEATQMVIEKLGEMEPGVEQTTAGVNLFGTMWEDLGMKGITALGNIDGEISLTKSSLDELNDIKYDNLSDAMDGVTRGALARFAQGFDEASTGAVDSLGSITTEINEGELGDAMENLGTAAGNFTTALSNIAAEVLPDIINGVAGFVNFFADAFTTPETEYSSFCETVKTESENLLSDVTQTKEDYESAMGDVSQLETYKEALLEINSTENASEYQKFKLKSIISKLSGTIPELAAAYDAETGSLQLTNEQIEDMISNQQKLMKQNAIREAVASTYDQIIQAEIDSAMAHEALRLAEEDLNKATERVNKTNQELAENMMAGSAVVGGEYIDAYNDAKEAVENTDEAQKQANQTLEVLTNVLDDMGLSIEEVMGAGEEAVETTDDLTETQDELIQRTKEAEEEVDTLTAAINEYAEKTGEASDTVREEFDSMADSYANAYNSAYNSITGQLGLFDEFNAGTATSAADVLKNLQSQVDGMKDWATNMQILSERGLDEGLIQELRDAGPAQAAQVAELVRQSDQFISDLNGIWREKTDIASGLSESMAEAETGFLAYAEQLGIDADTLAGVLEEKGIEIGSGYTTQFSKSLQDGTPDVKEDMNAIEQAAADKTAEYAEDGSTSADEYIENMSSGIGGAVFEIGASLALITGELFLFDLVMKGYGTSTAEGYMDNLESEMIEGMSGVETQIDKIKTAAAGLKNPLQSSGINAADGLIDGFSWRVNSRLREVAASAQAIVNRINSTLQIHSPSKVLEKTGYFGGEGLEIGLEAGMDEAIATADIKTHELIEAVSLSIPELYLPEIPTPSYSFPAQTAGNQTITNQSTSATMGGMVVNVYGSPGQDVNELADLVSERINAELASRKGAFA